jgi:hypothetical protein
MYPTAMLCTPKAENVLHHVKVVLFSFLPHRRLHVRCWSHSQNVCMYLESNSTTIAVPYLFTSSNSFLMRNSGPALVLSSALALPLIRLV